MNQNKSQKEQIHTKSESQEWSHDERINIEAGIGRLEQEKNTLGGSGWIKGFQSLSKNWIGGYGCIKVVHIPS